MAILYYPIGYDRLSEDEKSEICNGCGSKGLGGWLVPDTLYGLSITAACNIHDYMYSVGQTIQAKESADRTFMNNMVRIIEQDGSQWSWLVYLRKSRAKKYYAGVDTFGGSSFWDGKNTPESDRLHN